MLDSLVVGRWSLAVALSLALVWTVWPPLAGHSQDEALARAPLVQALRVGQQDGRTRLVLDFDKAVEHRWFTLPQPARLVVDFSTVQFVTQPSLVDLPAGSLIKGMRAGQFRPGVVRMVLDLTQPARISVFPIPGNGKRGPRLVIDVAPVKPGETATNVPPPDDVVTTVPWAPPGTTPPPADRTVEQPAPVAPRQVERRPGGPLVVTLDAGHGGVDPGACGKHLCEKYLTLDMVKRVGEKLADAHIKVVMTRDHDAYIPLGERSRIAERANANIFVSMHADSHPSREVHGATVYMVSERASDREAARLADSENAGDVLAGVDFENESHEVQGILISLIQRDTMNNSAYLARSVLDGMNGGDIDLRENKVLFAGFKVLKAPDVPSILIEMGYITNAREERQFGSERYRDKLATAIAAGIRKYLANYVHLNAGLGLKR
jgi:N-acetylmuramoyl-L-alanine amidase